MSQIPASLASYVNYGSQLSEPEVVHEEVLSGDAPSRRGGLHTNNPLARELNRLRRKDMGRTMRFVEIDGHEYRVYERGKGKNTVICASLAYNPRGDARVYRVCEKESDLETGLVLLAVQLGKEEARRQARSVS